MNIEDYGLLEDVDLKLDPDINILMSAQGKEFSAFASNIASGNVYVLASTGKVSLKIK